MAKDLLDFIQGPAAVDQEGCVLRVQVMQSQMGQAGIIAQSVPNPVDGRQRLASASNERMSDLRVLR